MCGQIFLNPAEWGRAGEGPNSGYIINVSLEGLGQVDVDVADTFFFFFPPYTKTSCTLV